MGAQGRRPCSPGPARRPRGQRSSSAPTGLTAPRDPRCRGVSLAPRRPPGRGRLTHSTDSAGRCGGRAGGASAGGRRGLTGETDRERRLPAARSARRRGLPQGTGPAPPHGRACVGLPWASTEAPTSHPPRQPTAPPPACQRPAQPGPPPPEPPGSALRPGPAGQPSPHCWPPPPSHPGPAVPGSALPAPRVPGRHGAGGWRVCILH